MHDPELVRCQRERPRQGAGDHGSHFLVYRNFEAILDSNCSNAYAVTVALLSDRIAGVK